MRFLSVDPRIKISILLLFGVMFTVSHDVFLLTKFLVFFLVWLLLTDVRSIKVYIAITLFSSFMVVVITNIFLDLDQNLIILMLVRLNSFITLFMWYSQDLDAEEISKTLVWFHVPYSFAIYVSSTFRYIYYFKRETEIISQSLGLRGVPLDRNFLVKLRSVHYVIPPLLFRTALASHNFTLALFNKNWTPYGEKTVLRPLNFHYKSNLLFIVLVIVIIFV